MPPAGKETDLTDRIAALQQQPLLARMGTALQVIAGVTPSTWFSPGQPVQSSAPPEVKGRMYDYMAAVNVRITPKDEGQVGYSELRALADSCYLLRLAIETRKDQMGKMGWTIKQRGAKDADKQDAKALELQDALQYPDRDHDMETWMRMMVEDMLVIDAASVYLRPNKGGSLYAAEPIDGATIKVLINQDGRRPAYPSPAYSQIIKGVPAAFYNTEELIFFPRNVRTHRALGYSPVEQLLLILLIAIRRDLSKLEFYTEGSYANILLKAAADWSPDQIDQFVTNFNSRLEGNTAERHKMQVIPGGEGSGVVEIKQALLKDEYDDFLVRSICWAIGITPQNMIQAVNKSTGETSRILAIEEGAVPHMAWFKRLVDKILWQGYKAPGYEFVWEEPSAGDPFTREQANALRLANGTACINEIREEEGKEGIPGGEVHTLTSASGLIPVARLATLPLEAPAPPPPAPAPAEAPKEGEPKPEDEQAPPPPEKVAKRARRIVKMPRNPVRAEVRDPLAQAVAKFLAAKAPAFVKAMQSVYPAPKAQKAVGDPSLTPEEEAAVDAALQKLVSGGEWDTLYRILIDPIAATGREASRLTLASIEVGGDEVIARTDARVLAYAESRAAELVGMQVVDGQLRPNPNPTYAITETTRQGIRDAVSAAVRDGMTVDELEGRIMQTGLFSETRANTIAETELAFANSSASMEAWKASGVVQGRVWMMSNDHADSDGCDSNAAAGPVPLDSPFPSGHMNPPAHPNCRCDIAAVLGEEMA